MYPSALRQMHQWGSDVLPKSRDLVPRLIKRGLDIKQTDWLGATFLHSAARDFDTGIASVLIDHGADIDAVDFSNRETPLTAAIRSEPWCANDSDRVLAKRKRVAMVKFLLRRGASRYPGVPTWALPLAVARNLGRTELEELLEP